MIEIDDGIFLTAEVIKTIGDEVIFPDFDTNTLWKINYRQEQSEAQLICRINEVQNGNRCFSDMQIKDNSVYLIPFSADSLYQVNINTGERTLLFDFSAFKTERNYFKHAKFMSSHLIGDNLYILPGAFPAIVKYNVKDKTIKIIDEWINQDKIRDLQNGYFRKTINHNGIIIAPFCDLNAVLLLNTLKDEIKIEYLDTPNGFCSVCMYGEKMYLTPRSYGKIVVYDNNKYKSLSNDVASNMELLLWEDYVIAIPSGEGNILIIDKKERCSNELDILGSYLSATIDKDGRMIIMSKQRGKLYIFEDKEKYYEVLVKPDVVCGNICMEEYKKRFWDKYKSVKECAIMEKSYSTISDFILHLKDEY